MENLSSLEEIKMKIDKALLTSPGAAEQKRLRNLLDLTEEIQKHEMPTSVKSEIATKLSVFAVNLHSLKEIKEFDKHFRKILREEYGFISENFYLSIGVGVGLAIGTSIGINMGVFFDASFVIGSSIGSGVGLMLGIIIGSQVDLIKKKEKKILKKL